MAGRGTARFRRRGNHGPPRSPAARPGGNLAALLCDRRGR